jgi:hypothetical protein
VITSWGIITSGSPAITARKWRPTFKR